MGRSWCWDQCHLALKICTKHYLNKGESCLALPSSGTGKSLIYSLPFYPSPGIAISGPSSQKILGTSLHLSGNPDADIQYVLEILMCVLGDGATHLLTSKFALLIHVRCKLVQNLTCMLTPTHQLTWKDIRHGTKGSQEKACPKTKLILLLLFYITGFKGNKRH